MNRRRFLTSLAGLAALTLVPKRARAAAFTDPTPLRPEDMRVFRQYLRRVYAVRPDDIDATVDEWSHVKHLMDSGRLCYRNGEWRMGLIDKDHVPEGTKLSEWTRSYDGMIYAAHWKHISMDDIKQEVYYHHPDGQVTTTRISPHHVALICTGSHPIYARLFPMPGATGPLPLEPVSPGVWRNRRNGELYGDDLNPL